MIWILLQILDGKGRTRYPSKYYQVTKQYGVHPSSYYYCRRSNLFNSVVNSNGSLEYCGHIDFCVYMFWDEWIRSARYPIVQCVLVIIVVVVVIGNKSVCDKSVALKQGDTRRARGKCEKSNREYETWRKVIKRNTADGNCSKCGTKGHTAPGCNSSEKCFNRKSFKHIAANCREIIMESEKTGPLQLQTLITENIVLSTAIRIVLQPSDYPD
ncbi:hypothetical protein WN48_05310 [Eufriesea mexicana]|uniref:CCHC-type domain-containing protein n=1 Tax=Eufriesea mexicana TaxID=516756 RepID=A0A310SA09_9HYME|nr:hypothetical protein WN48_05310 [Eufriesea mexicana]